MKKIIKHYPMTDRLIVRGGYISAQKIATLFDALDEREIAR
jgi:hypothetical protein